jgi:hypothetical protein
MRKYLDKLLENIQRVKHQDDIVRAGLRKMRFGRDKKPESLIYRLKSEPIWKDMVPRYLIANIGGATLLIPMIIMSFAESKTAHLIITSLFVLGFAFVISIGAVASNQELLGATAAYAAVLVVYVGTSSSN